MASFYSNASNEEDIIPTAYSLNQKLISYSSSGLPNNKGYASQPSVSESYLNLLSASNILAHDHVDNNYVRSTGERTIIPPTGFPTDVQQVDTQLNFMCRFSDCGTVTVNPHAFTKELEHGHSPKQKSPSHGLCLSLGSQEQSLDQMTSNMNQYANSSLCSLLSSHVLQSEDHLSQRINLKNVEYLSFDLSGGNQDAVKYETNNFQNLISSKDTISLPFLHQTSESSGTLCHSKYLKAAQDLLDEVVNVHTALETSEKGKNKTLLGPDGSKEIGARVGETSAEFQESTTNAPDVSLSPTERHNLQNKMTKLVSMLEEVDRRYKQYSHQMQAVVSSFDMVAGNGVAKQYSVLALRTISRQFRSLRDAIKKQIQEDTQNNLGEQGADSHGQGVLSRLRYVDQKLRQQKIVQQFGIMRQPWRPQRGLPETAVSVLRAWLFEHFLHPYPKDSEKSILARQTGLTRSQVANWFINARVRLWKPMIEDIYKEEFGDAETEPKSSPEHTPVTQVIPALKGTEEGLQESLISAASDGKRWGHSIESRHNVFSSAELSYEAEVFQENEINYGLTHLQKQHISQDSTSRHNDMILNGSMGNQVSLALGYTHSERDSQPISVENKSKGNGAESSSMGVDKLEYYDEDTINHQSRFVNPNGQLSDFVL